MEEETENPSQGIDIFAFMCYTKYALVNFYFCRFVFCLYGEEVVFLAGYSSLVGTVW